MTSFPLKRVTLYSSALIIFEDIMLTLPIAREAVSSPFGRGLWKVLVNQVLR